VRTLTRRLQGSKGEQKSPQQKEVYSLVCHASTAINRLEHPAVESESGANSSRDSRDFGSDDRGGDEGDGAGRRTGDLLYEGEISSAVGDDLCQRETRELKKLSYRRARKDEPRAGDALHAPTQRDDQQQV
jgi:hypothetical protein